MRLPCVLALLVVLAPGWSAQAAKPARRKPKDKLEKSIDKALVFLKNHERVWQAQASRNSAITALTVMAFLSAGHTPGDGPYGKVVEQGVRAVLKAQHANGLIATVGHYEMYQHGICTLMLAEAAGMTEDKELAKEIKRRLVKAVKIILQAQRLTSGQTYHGGWRYRVDQRYDLQPPADISVTGWQLLALRAAKNLGCDVPQKRIEYAVAYIKRCRDPSTGGFRYQPGSRVTIPCTGTSILGLEICGKDFHRSAEARKAAEFLNKREVRWNGWGHFFYGVYYCSQAMFQLGGNYWKAYRPHLHKVLLDNQNATNGSWHTGDGFGANYDTAMAVLALTVEYRYLPIYQRDEGEEKTTRAE